MKVLFIALPGIGDALLSTPAIHTLRKHYPEATIDVLCMFRGTKDILDHNDDINNVILWDFIHSSWFKSLRFIISIRKKYDASINIYPQNRREYNLIGFLIGAPKRVGIKYLRRDKRNFSWLMTHRILENDSLHCTEENLKVLSFFNINESDPPPLILNVDPKVLIWGEKWLESSSIEPNDVVIGFHAGTATFKNHIKRRWEPEKFSKLAEMLMERYNAKILLFGGKEEMDLCEKINKVAGNKCIIVQTDSIMQTIALMRRCNIFISNDSALMHIAGALQLPTVGIFGPTNERYVHPWKTRYSIVHTGIECRPCFYYSPKPLTCYRIPSEHFKCIRDLSVEMVLKAAENFIYNRQK